MKHCQKKSTIGGGGVAAIFDEIPYIKLFLAKFCSMYTMVGPTYKTDGFGFVSISLSQQNKKQKKSTSIILLG